MMNINDLKVGDVVYIREDLEDDKLYGNNVYIDDMCKGIQEIGFVSRENGIIRTVETPDYSYTPEMIDWDKTMHLNIENLSGVHDEEQDKVNSPSHYSGGGKHNIECYKAIEYILDRLENVPERYYGHVSNVIKYVWRCNNKNGYEDLDKASVYFDFMFREED